MDLHRHLSLFVLLQLATVLAWAEPRVSIDQHQISLTDFRIGYHVDPSQELTFEEVRTLSFTETGNRTSLGTNARVTWFKLILDNTSDIGQRLFVHLPHAYHLKSVAIYQERNGELVHSDLLDMNRIADTDMMFRGTAVYPLFLPADQSTTLYLRSFSYSHQWLAIEVLGAYASRHTLVSINTDIALMVGMLLALVFYNGLLYFATSRKENIFYSLYLISGLVWIALSYGLIASVFDIYGDAIFKLNLSLFTMPIFLLLFMMAIFETKISYPTEHRFLQGLIVLLGGTLIWGVFDISAALKPASSLAALMMVVTLTVGISLYRKGHPLAKYFLLGHSLFVVFNGIAVLVYKGLVPPSYLSSHGVGIGIMLEALTLAFVISHRIKLLEDIRTSQEELKKQASTDPLTRLYNRRFFFPEANYLLELAKEKDIPLSIMILDIDHFKRVNDHYGHACGDQVIIKLAEILKEQSRASDLIARLGGEEFVILLPDTNLLETSQYAERIRIAAEDLEVIANVNKTVHVAISIGVAELDTEQESIESALARADKALYQAKNSGRNRVCRAEPPVRFGSDQLADHFTT